MPVLANSYHEIATVTSYEYNSFGNSIFFHLVLLYIKIDVEKNHILSIIQ